MASSSSPLSEDLEVNTLISHLTLHSHSPRVAIGSSEQEWTSGGGVAETEAPGGEEEEAPGGEEEEAPDGAALRHAQTFGKDITLSNRKPHPSLILSEDRKQVRYIECREERQRAPKMFPKYMDVLGDRGFQSENFYFEVFVGGKISWCLGVATASFERGGPCNANFCREIWAIRFLQGRIQTFTSPVVTVTIGRHRGEAKRVGVFVDYERREISFYDVATATLICAFTGCSFTEALYPYLNPSTDPAPMIIVPGGRD